MATVLSAPSTGAVSPTGGAASASPPAAPLAGAIRQAGASRVTSVRTLEWSARGFTKVLGNVEVGRGVTSGSLAIGGSLTGGELDLSGTTRVECDVRAAKSLRTRGSFRAGGSLFGRTVRLSGMGHISGGVEISEGLRWDGSLDVGQDVRSDAVRFHGSLHVLGTLRARTISGVVERLSSVGAIEADWVEIRRRPPLLPFALPILPPPAWHTLAVARIEATEAHLSGVRAHRLKADRIWLGPNTHVEYVEGTIVERDKTAHVGPESESPPPPGMNR